MNEFTKYAEAIYDACIDLSERLNIALAEAREILREQFENIENLLQQLHEDMKDELTVFDEDKPNTPYRSKCKSWIFDKRLRIHRCRNNC